MRSPRQASARKHGGHSQKPKRGRSGLVHRSRASIHRRAPSFVISYWSSDASLRLKIDALARLRSQRPENGFSGPGLDTLNLGRAEFGLALTTRPKNAAKHLSEALKLLQNAVDKLQGSNVSDEVPHAHLARARLLRATGDFADARRDLDEVFEIAEPGSMRLHLCDRHLELCRLAFAERDGYAPLADKSVAPAKGDERDKLTEQAQAELKAASDLIEQCGYHRRDAERDELAEVLAGKRLFRDLPIRV